MLQTRIKKVLKKNKIIYFLFSYRYKIKFRIQDINFRILSFFRYIGLSNNYYSKLKKMKNIHENHRCFIIATGPSLVISDVEKLNNEYTISMNSMCLALTNTEWRPTYYGIQDEEVYKKVEGTLKNINLENVFISDNISRKNTVSKKWIKFPLNKYYNSFEFRFLNKYNVKFSDECYRTVYDGYTITYSLIQLAVYMGFKEIYLLGCDNDYSDDKGKQHFNEYGHLDSRYKTAGERMTVGYYAARKYANNNGIEIYNATRGGNLDVFPRVNLDEVIK